MKRKAIVFSVLSLALLAACQEEVSSHKAASAITTSVAPTTAPATTVAPVATTLPANRKASPTTVAKPVTMVPVESAKSSSSFDHINLGQSQVTLGEALSSAALEQLNATAAPMYQYPKGGTSVVLIYATDGLVTKITIADGSRDYFDVAGVRQGINVDRLSQLVSGLEAVELPSASGSDVASQPALFRADGAGGTYFIPGWDEVCHPTNEVASIMLAIDGQAENHFGCSTTSAP